MAKDWRNPKGSKKDKKYERNGEGYTPKKKRRPEAEESPAPTDEKKTERRDGEKTTEGIHPVGELVMRLISQQIEDYLAVVPRDREKAAKRLFDVGGYPSTVDGCEGAENFSVLQVDKDNRPTNRSGVEKRMSTILILMDKSGDEPRVAFMVEAFVTPKGKGNVRVLPIGEDGPDYRNTIRWNNNEN